VKDDDQLLVVVAHLLKAIKESNDFPERAERQRLWVAPTAAASMVDEESKPADQIKQSP